MIKFTMEDMDYENNLVSSRFFNFVC